MARRHIEAIWCHWNIVERWRKQDCQR